LLLLFIRCFEQMLSFCRVVLSTTTQPYKNFFLFTLMLLKIALITALLGTVLLFFLSQSLEPQLIEIKDINIRMLDQYVKIQGNIISIEEKNSLTLLKIKDDSGEITGVLYEKEEIEIKKDQVIIGKVTEYHGKLEIEVSKIEAK